MSEGNQTGTAGHVERKKPDLKKSELGIGGSIARHELCIVWDSYLRSLLLVRALFCIDVCTFVLLFVFWFAILHGPVGVRVRVCYYV